MPQIVDAPAGYKVQQHKTAQSGQQKRTIPGHAENHLVLRSPFERKAAVDKEHQPVENGRQALELVMVVQKDDDPVIDGHRRGRRAVSPYSAVFPAEQIGDQTYGEKAAIEIPKEFHPDRVHALTPLRAAVP